MGFELKFTVFSKFLLLCASLVSALGSPLGNPYGPSHAGPPHSHAAYSWSPAGSQPAHAGAQVPSHSYPVGHPSAAHAPEHVPTHAHTIQQGQQGIPAYAATHTSALLDAIAAHLISTHPLMQMKSAAYPHAGSSEHHPHTPSHMTVHPHVIPAGVYGSTHAAAHAHLAPSSHISEAQAQPHPHLVPYSYMTPAHAPAHPHSVRGAHSSAPHAPALPHAEPHYASPAGHPGAHHIPTQITPPGATIPHAGHYGNHADHQVSQIIQAHMHAIQQHIDSHEKAHCYGKTGVCDHFRATKHSAHALAPAVHNVMAAQRRAVPYTAAHVPTAPAHPLAPHGTPAAGHYPAPQPLKPVHVMAPSSKT